jgi:hypothetical protein
MLNDVELMTMMYRIERQRENDAHLWKYQDLPPRPSAPGLLRRLVRSLGPEAWIGGSDIRGVDGALDERPRPQIAADGLPVQEGA